jgi:predicted transcriptional regulator
MFSKEILINTIPVLKPGDSGLQALALMDEWKLKHLPVVKEGHYLCLLSERDVFGMTDQKGPVENVCLFAPFVREDSSVLEVLHIMNKNFLSVLPVVGEREKYLGSVTLPALIESLNELCHAGSKGALIAIEDSRHDYVLSQIIHLIESNNANIQSFFTYFLKETSKQMLLFKIDLEDASPVLRSLERFNYKVSYCLQKQLLTDETMKDRLDELIFYLEM